MATTSAQIAAALKELIGVKITGASDLSDLADRRLGELGVNMATSLVKLQELLKLWEAKALYESGDVIQEMSYFPES